MQLYTIPGLLIKVMMDDKLIPVVLFLQQFCLHRETIITVPQSALRELLGT